MKIMIGGGFDENESNPDRIENMQRFAESLARQVVLQGHRLRCGNITTLDAAVISAACDAADGQDVTDLVISYAYKDQEAKISLGTVRDSANSNWDSMSGRRPSVPEPIDEADVLILIGGYEGTFTAANWARQSATPVLPVATFGMAASDILDDELGDKVGPRIARLPDDDLSRLKRAASTLNGDEADKYAAEVVALAERAALSREVFVAMSFEEKQSLRAYQDALKMVCKERGFSAERIDQRSTGETYDIVQKIHCEIEASGFVVADLTGARPNVYYEIGYARGLGKPIILTMEKDAEVHFDIAGQKVIRWETHLDLREKLDPELKELSIQFGIGT